MRFVDKSQARAAMKFNEAHPVGTPVRYWTGAREGEGKLSKTVAPALVLNGHTAVVAIEGVASYVALSHVKPEPTKPAAAKGA